MSPISPPCIYFDGTLPLLQGSVVAQGREGVLLKALCSEQQAIAMLTSYNVYPEPPMWLDVSFSYQDTWSAAHRITTTKWPTYTSMHNKESLNVMGLI